MEVQGMTSEQYLLPIVDISKQLLKELQALTKGEFKVLTSPSRTIEQMNMFGVDIDKRIFNPDFEMSKEMLIEELRKDLPSKMCGWKDEHLDEFL